MIPDSEDGVKKAHDDDDGTVTEEKDKCSSLNEAETSIDIKGEAEDSQKRAQLDVRVSKNLEGVSVLYELTAFKELLFSICRYRFSILVFDSYYVLFHLVSN